MYKVLIKKYEKHPVLDCGMLSEYSSIDAVKPYDISEEEWGCIADSVKDLAYGNKNTCKRINGSACYFEMKRLENNEDGDILAESEHFLIRRDYEDASIFRKPDSKRITCVGDFYGDPEAAYIDPQERFCIVIGCGIIKYNLTEPFEEYMYDTDTPQWLEVGREGNIEWCDRIEQVTDTQVIVSCEGEDIRKYNINTLALEE